MMILKNREAVLEKLTEMLIQFDKDANTNYQTDVYLYYDEKSQTAELDTFVNVGGNSWLNDNHYTIYTDKEHYDDGLSSWCQSVEELAELAEITVDQLKKEIVQDLELDEDEIEDFEVDYYEAQKYLSKKADYMEKLTAAYEDFIDDLYSEYQQKAESIIESFENGEFLVF